MTIEKLWSVEFVSGLSSEGGGVIVLEDGKILGGNNNYFYVGSYNLINNKFNATVDMKRYYGNCNPIFGKHDELILKLTGDFDEEEMLLTGYILEDPSREFHIRLKYHTEVFRKLAVQQSH